jgi:hypothetical protein
MTAVGLYTSDFLSDGYLPVHMDDLRRPTTSTTSPGGTAATLHEADLHVEP